MTHPHTVAIVHYHLRPGGVARVVEHAAEALDAAGARVAVLVGEAPPEATANRLPAELRIVDGLGYDEETGPVTDPSELARDLKNAAKDALGSAPDLWHVHNHALGKNLAVPGALRQLADDGHRLLLQEHDFAEDGRPANYRRLLQHVGHGDTARLGEYLYPLADHVHYATLNGRDRRHLIEAGLPEPRAHALPNAVQLPIDIGDENVPDLGPGRLFLYPTRAIRRKNIGELLLWAALAERDDDRFATTMGPANPTQRPTYERWLALANRLNLPIEWEIGSFADASFTALLRSAHAILTTSVAEGFGLAFVEPWLADRPLLGRNLPDITEDFTHAGLDLSALYPSLGVPLDWVGEHALRKRIGTALHETLTAYGRPCTEGDVDHAMAGAVDAHHRVDFGRLDEPLQQQVIERVAESPEARREMSPAGLEVNGAADSAIIEHNKRIVRETFSLAGYGDRLRGVYQRVLDSPTGAVEGLDGRAVLDRFLRPERFCLLRT